MDLGVLYRDEPDILEIGVVIEELEALFGGKVDLVDLRGLEASDPRLAYEIASDGIVVTAADDASFPAFKTRAFLAYFDIRPFLERRGPSSMRASMRTISGGRSMLERLAQLELNIATLDEFRKSIRPKKFPAR